MPESQGNSAPKAGEGSGAPEGTDQQKPAGMTAEEFNQAFSAREKSFNAKIAKAQSEQLAALRAELTESFGKTLAEQLAALKPKDEPKGKTETPTFKLEDLPEWKASQQELAALKAKAAKSDAEAAAERAKGRATSLRTSATEALVKAGIPADRTKGALALLMSEGRINYADAGKGDALVFVAQDGEQSLDEGLKSWVKGPDAKIYLPPQNPHGSGGGPGAPGNGANNPYADVSDVLRRHVMGQQ